MHLSPPQNLEISIVGLFSFLPSPNFQIRFHSFLGFQYITCDENHIPLWVQQGIYGAVKLRCGSMNPGPQLRTANQWVECHVNTWLPSCRKKDAGKRQCMEGAICRIDMSGVRRYLALSHSDLSSEWLWSCERGGKLQRSSDSCNTYNFPPTFLERHCRNATP